MTHRLVIASFDSFAGSGGPGSVFYDSFNDSFNDFLVKTPLKQA